MYDTCWTPATAAGQMSASDCLDGECQPDEPEQGGREALDVLQGVHDSSGKLWRAYLLLGRLLLLTVTVLERLVAQDAAAREERRELAADEHAWDRPADQAPRDRRAQVAARGCGERAELYDGGGGGGDDDGGHAGACSEWQRHAAALHQLRENHLVVSRQYWC